MSDLPTEEQKILLENFRKMFANRQNEAIAIYGLGINTQFLLSHSKDYNIVGLMDAENVGKTMFGYPVLSLEEAVKKVDCIIIVARPAYQKIIYKRIVHLQKYKIQICNLHGIAFENMELNENYENNDYWNKSVAELKYEIDQYEVISFDIFDTLIMRKILRSYNIFDVIEQELQQDYQLKIPFKEMRIRAEENLKKECPSPSLEKIYEELVNLLHVKEEKKIIMQKELMVENRFMVQRVQMVKVLLYAKEKGKKIYLTSDMYLNRNQLEEILNNCKIFGYDDIIISSEWGKTKEEGSLFQVLKEKEKGKRILHIGDNVKADIENARKHGVDAYYIMSSYEMMMKSQIGALLTHVSSLQDCLFLGMFAAKALNDPFSLNQGKGKMTIQFLEEIGYLFYAPIIMSFMIWFLKEMKKRKNTFILFSARDGYLIEKLYRMIVEKLNMSDMPKAKYFFTSRRAVTVATFEKEEDLILIIEKTTGSFMLGELLNEKFGIKALDSRRNEIISLPSQKESAIKYILQYKENILENAKREKINYLTYVKNNLSLENKKLVLFDLVSSGTIPFYLKKLLNKEVQLNCFATINLPNMYYSDYTEIKSLFGNSSSAFPEHSFLKYYFLWESVLTAPDSQLCCFDDKGKPMFCKKGKAQFDFGKIEKIHQGIYQYINEMISLKVPFIEQNSHCQFADFLWGLINPSSTNIPQKIMDLFVFENCYEGVKEKKIWNDLF